MAVIVHDHTYLVTKHIISKDRTCSCGNRRCWAIQEVGRYLREGGTRAPDAVSLEHHHTLPSFDFKELAGQVKRLQWGHKEDGEYPRWVRPRYVPSEPMPLTPEGRVDYQMWAERIRAKCQWLLSGSTGGNSLQQWAREVLIARAGMTFENVGYLPEVNR